MLCCRGGLVRSEAQAHADATFKEATETDGFYNRPAGEGRFPVRSVDSYRTPYPVNEQAVYPVHDRYALFSCSRYLSTHVTRKGSWSHLRDHVFITGLTPRMMELWTLSYTASAFPPRSVTLAAIPG